MADTNQAYRMANKLKHLADSSASYPADDSDMLLARIVGNAIWDGSAWTLTPQGLAVVEQLS